LHFANYDGTFFIVNRLTGWDAFSDSSIGEETQWYKWLAPKQKSTLIAITQVDFDISHGGY